MLLLLFIVAFVIVELALFAFDKYIWSFFVLVAAGAFAYYTSADVREYITAIGWGTILTYYVPMYLVAGGVTAVVKWLLFVRGVASDISEMRTEFDLFTNRKPQDELVDGSDTSLAAKRHRFLEYLQLSKHGYSYLSKTNMQYRFRTEDLAPESALVDVLTPRTKQYIDRITFWVLQWPIVLLSLVLEDLILKVGKHVARVIDAVFNRLARALVGSAVKGM